MQPSRTYSISIRLRRTAIDEAFVNIQITNEIMQAEPDDQGVLRLDPEKVTAAAILLGSDPGTHWKPEGNPIIELHPIQISRPN